MLAYILERLAQSVLVVLGVSVLVFGLLYASGDPVRLMLPADAKEQEIEEYRHALGLDRPLPLQYLAFLSRAVQGDFGQSFRHREAALSLVLERVPASAELALASLVFALGIAIPLGILSALKKDSFLDLGATVLAIVWQCAPTFWLGIILILIFAETLRWLPAAGRGGLESLVLPSITLGAFTAAIVMRLLRSSLLEVLGSDYVRTAQAKGLESAAILLRHALKNAAIPVITVVGLQVGVLLGGAVITEQVFGYPGMGRLALQAVVNRDYPVVQVFVMLSALVIVGANLLVDLLYTVVDPRIRYR